MYHTGRLLYAIHLLLCYSKDELLKYLTPETDRKIIAGIGLLLREHFQWGHSMPDQIMESEKIKKFVFCLQTDDTEYVFNCTKPLHWNYDSSYHWDNRLTMRDCWGWMLKTPPDCGLHPRERIVLLREGQ